MVKGSSGSVQLELGLARVKPHAEMSRIGPNRLTNRIKSKRVLQTGLGKNGSGTGLVQDRELLNRLSLNRLDLDKAKSSKPKLNRFRFLEAAVAAVQTPELPSF